MNGDFALAQLPKGGDRTARFAFPKGPYRLHAMLAGVGFERQSGPDYRWDGRTRGAAPFVTLQHAISGVGRLRYEGRQYSIKAGQTMLVRAPHDHTYWVSAGGQWEFFWLLLHGREVLRICGEVLALRGPVMELPREVVSRLAAVCLEALDGGAATPARASSLAYAAVMAVAEGTLPLADPDHPQHGRPTAIERAVSLCYARAADGLSVAALADAVGYSRHHFSRLFATKEGVTPTRFLLNRRMEAAVALLRGTDLPMKVVAQRCGFADANYFAKAFRKHHGVNPRTYRMAGPRSGQPSQG
jgi:AraC-like DNA-binding protein